MSQLRISAGFILKKTSVYQESGKYLSKPGQTEKYIIKKRLDISLNQCMWLLANESTLNEDLYFIELITVCDE